MVNFISVRTLGNKLNKFIESLIHKFPRCYLGFVTLIAIIGYAFVLLFPILVVAGIPYIYLALTASDVINWQYALIWSVIVLFACLISYRSTQIKPVPPAGLSLTEDKAPELFKLVHQLHNHYRRPIIHRLVITGNYQLDIIKTPRWALPVWSINTMVIGLPVLQGLTPKQFECMVARRVGQFSKRENPLTNWLYQLRPIWQQYRHIYAKQKRFGSEIMKWFFAVYAPFYMAISVYAARRDELNADSYAMELFNDEDVREMVTADAVCRWYLHNQYWPAVYKIASVETKSLPTPHTKMAAAVHANLKSSRLDILVNKVFNQKPARKNAMPSLRQRIKNIGHEQPGMYDTTENAAIYYLGTSMQGVVSVIDKLWLQTLLQQRKRQRHKAQNSPMPKQVTSA